MDIFYVHILSWLEHHLLPCFFKSFFMIDCPGCGFQRSLLALAKGDIVASIHYYPGLIPLLVYFVFLFLHGTYKFRFGQKIIVKGAVVIFVIILTSYIFKLSNHI